MSNSEQTDLLAFLIDNINLVIILFIGFLLVSLVIFIIILILNSGIIQNLKTKFINLIFLDYDQFNFLLSKIAIIFLFFDLFIFLTLNILTNTIQTDKVIN